MAYGLTDGPVAVPTRLTGVFVADAACEHPTHPLAMSATKEQIQRTGTKQPE